MKINIDYYIDPKTKKKIYKLNYKNIFFFRKIKESILKKKQNYKKIKKRTVKKRNVKKFNKKKNIQPIIHEIETKLPIDVQPISTEPIDENLPLSFYLENSTDYVEEDIGIDYSSILKKDTFIQRYDNKIKIEYGDNKEGNFLIQSKPEKKLIENENLFQEHLDKIKAKQNKISKQIRKKQLRLLEKEKIKKQNKYNKKKETHKTLNETLNKKNIVEYFKEEKEIEDNILKVPNLKKEKQKKEKQKKEKLYSIEDEGFEVKDSYGKVDGLYYKIDKLGTIEVPIVQDEDNKIFLKIPDEDTFNKYLYVFIGTFNHDKRTIYLPSKGKYDIRFIRWIYEEKKKYRKLMNNI